MPIMTTPPTAPAIVALVPAGPGAAVVIGPIATPVVAWVLLADPTQSGGARIDPVFVAAGRTWTPDQYHADYGTRVTVIAQ